MGGAAVVAGGELVGSHATLPDRWAGRDEAGIKVVPIGVGVAEEVELPRPLPLLELLLAPDQLR